MFRNDTLKRPKNISVLLTVIMSLFVYVGSEWNAYIGYSLAILTMIMIGMQCFLSFTVWPTLAKAENPFLFSVYWGLIVGLVIPYLVTRVIEDGFSSIIELIKF